MEVPAITALIGSLAAAAAVSTTIEADLFVDAERESKRVIEKYDQRKREEYDQICQLMKCEYDAGEDKYVF